MGADFCYAVVPKFEWTKQREELLRGVLDRTESSVLRTTAENWCLDCKIPELDLDPPEGVSTTDWFAEVNQKLRDYFFQSIKDAQESGPGREVCELYLPDLPYSCWITGGMSWGDSPTDSYDDFNACGMLEDVWQLILDFAREDYAKIGQAKREECS